MSKPSIVLHCSAADEPSTGWPKFAVAVFKEKFVVVWLKDVIANPDLGKRVQAAAYVPHNKACNIPSIEEYLSLLPNLRVISNYCVGMDHWLEFYPELEKRGIVTTNLKTPKVLHDATADMAMCLMLAAARDLRGGIMEAMGPTPVANFNEYPSVHRDVSFGVLGIFGMGSIGYKVAQRAKGFHMKILYHNRTRRSTADEEVVGASYYADLYEMLREVDFLVIACPLTDSTRYKFGSEEFDCMKPTAIVVNVARGAVIKTDDLVSALENKKILAAGLDVTDPEPLPRDHPLLKLPNVIISPHSGTRTAETCSRMTRLVMENALAIVEGRTTENVWRPS